MVICPRNWSKLEVGDRKELERFERFARLISEAMACGVSFREAQEKIYFDVYPEDRNS